MKIRGEIKAGIILVITITVFVWGFNFLKGRNLLKATNSYYAVYERIDGLNESAPVYIHGYQVGLVSDIKLADDLEKVIVKIHVDSRYSLTENTIASIFSTDFMGTRAVELIPGEKRGTIPPGDTLLTALVPDLKEEVFLHLLPVKEKAEGLILSADSLLGALNVLFDEEFTDDLASAVASGRETARLLQKAAYSADTLLSSEEARFKRILYNLDNASVNILSLSDSLAASDLHIAVNKLKEVLDSSGDLIANMNSGEGTIGQMLHDEELYMNLKRATDNLDRLLKDFRENPGRYVSFSLFGRRSSGNDPDNN